tara:strand:+ start:303 stop:407 length:105 start_codon:yes stop_codon:yes gene_type:complete
MEVIFSYGFSNSMHYRTGGDLVGTLGNNLMERLL